MKANTPPPLEGQPDFCPRPTGPLSLLLSAGSSLCAAFSPPHLSRSRFLYIIPILFVEVLFILPGGQRSPPPRSLPGFVSLLGRDTAILA